MGGEGGGWRDRVGNAAKKGRVFKSLTPGANCSLILLGNPGIQQRRKPQNCTSWVVSELGYLYPTPAGIG